MIVSVISQKGGAGKTTLALGLAAAWAAEKLRVLVIDADIQGTARDWAAVRTTPAPFQVRHLAEPTLHRQAPDLARQYDRVVIDGPPRIYEVSKSAIGAADLVLIPAQPSGADFWAIAPTVELVREVDAIRKRRAALVVSRRIGASRLSRDFAAQLLGAYGLPVLTAGLSQRVAYADAMTYGATVLEHDPRGAAAAEVRALAAEIAQVMA